MKSIRTDRSSQARGDPWGVGSGRDLVARTEQWRHVGSPEQQRIPPSSAPAPAKARQSDSIRTDRSAFACVLSRSLARSRSPPPISHRHCGLQKGHRSHVGHEAARSALLPFHPRTAPHRPAASPRRRWTRVSRAPSAVAGKPRWGGFLLGANTLHATRCAGAAPTLRQAAGVPRCGVYWQRLKDWDEGGARGISE